MRRIALLAACLLVLITPASLAEDPSAVIIRDARGDAGPNGVGVPGFEFLDVVEVSLVGETNKSVDLRIQVASVASAPPFGEVAVHFRLGSAWWLVGWTTIPTTSPPFTYRGGFFCPSDANGGVDPNRCDGFDAKIANNAYLITMDRSTLRAVDAGVVLERPKAYGDAYNPGIRFDETSIGGSYVFKTGNVSNPSRVDAQAPTPEPSPSEAMEHPEVSPRGSASTTGLLLTLLTIVFVAARRR